MKDQYYAFYLDDPASASFTSFDKLYVGTLDELKEVIKRVHGIRGYEDTIAAFEAFLGGSEGGTHRIAQRNMPILTPVVLKASSEMELGYREWEHLNLWQCPYNMKFESAKIRQIIIKHENEFIRLIKATIKNLCYENTVGNWTQTGDCFWGHGFIMDVIEDADGKNIEMTNILYVTQSRSKLLREEKAKLNDESMLDFKEICDEIFGDG